ncbi:MAG: VPLPA-CTERM sorting domain-containing protein [Gammaproteobacteria bacterium]|nr:VPLPA-CTERM sorting domain-containing protein [Gammaproteobacteria bacterium]
MNFTKYLSVLGFFCASSFAISVQAATLGFACITGNNTTDCAIGESQLTVDVSDTGSNTVLFNFFNTGSAQSTISEIYFDDGSLLAIASIDKTGKDANIGVSFSQYATPPDLPGGNTISPAFVVTAGFLADADDPAPKWGVNIGESVGITYTLQGTQTFADVINELTTGQLRIGLHVINFESGGSESFVNNPVPVPAALWLFGSGLLALVGVVRRKH